MAYRIFYAAGPGDIIQSHKHWMQNEHDPTEVSITFSSQFEDFCREIGADAYIVSYHRRKEIFRDGPFTLEHRPKPMPGATGARYHLAEVLYGLGLLATALRFKADLAVIDSGSTHYFITTLFRLMGIRVVPVLHNTLWPHGFPPTRPVPRLILWLDSLFFRRVPMATIGVSPECTRQVEQLTRGRHTPLLQVRAQFRPEYFENIPPPPPHDQRNFRIMFIGRVNRIKGVFDILEIARKVEARAPGRVRWEICGSGPDLEELRQRQHAMGLEPIVHIRGWTSLPDLIEVYARSHASIVPTRSSFTEGLAMTAAEAILAGRPLITNPVVPALELLRPACVEARTNDVDSYVEGILKLVDEPNYYDSLCQACPSLQEQFYDRDHGLTAVLRRVIRPIQDTERAPST
ncbi:MAG: glycosyltransferase family 4 protein [Planctomycetaceae bacterium]